MIRYVLGFLIEKRTRQVALITKSHPAWQAGKLNGVGGEIEAGESDLEAMVREWRQETKTRVTDWHVFYTLVSPDMERNPWECVCFYSSFEHEVDFTPTPLTDEDADEPVNWYPLRKLVDRQFQGKLVDNVYMLLNKAIELVFPAQPAGDTPLVVAMHSTGFIHAPGMVENWLRMTGRHRELAFWQVAMAFPELSPMFITDMLERRVKYKVDGTSVIFDPWRPGPLENYWDADSIKITWTVDDVLTAANREDWLLHRDEAREILQEAERDHDASIGICWSTLDNLVSYRKDRMGRAMTEEEKDAHTSGSTIYLDADDQAQSD